MWSSFPQQGEKKDKHFSRGYEEREKGAPSVPPSSTCPRTGEFLSSRTHSIQPQPPVEEIIN